MVILGMLMLKLLTMHAVDLALAPGLVFFPPPPTPHWRPILGCKAPTWMRVRSCPTKRWWWGAAGLLRMKLPPGSMVHLKEIVGDSTGKLTRFFFMILWGKHVALTLPFGFFPNQRLSRSGFGCVGTRSGGLGKLVSAP